MSQLTTASQFLASHRLRVLKDTRVIIYPVLNSFAGVAKTETAFYLHFCSLGDDDEALLRRFYSRTGDFDVFRLVCKRWNVRRP